MMKNYKLDNTKRSYLTARPRLSAGFSLIELLVAVVILAVEGARAHVDAAL